MSAVMRLFLAFALLGCGPRPRVRVMTLIDACTDVRGEAAEERCTGVFVDRMMVSHWGTYDDEGLRRYITTIGERLADHVDGPRRDFRFRILDDANAQAFAAPGGYVYITRGMLAALSSEAQLAGVLAHEIGHIIAGHTDYQWRQLPESTSVGIAGAFAHARDDEMQADYLALVLLERAGYDPRALARAFGTFAYSDASPGHWASRHPPLLSRIALLTRAADGRTGGSVGGRMYAENIDGLIIGTDPRDSYYTESHAFFPRAGFSIALPQGRGEGTNTLNVGRIFVLNSLLDGFSPDWPSMGGLPVEVGDWRSQTNDAGETILGRSATIAGGDGYYSIAVYGAAEREETLHAAFDAILASLHRVESFEVPPARRLRALVVDAPGTLLHWATEHCGPPDADELTQLNGMALSDGFSPGDVMKCVR